MANNTPTPNLEALAREILTDAVTYAEVTGINFFKDSFNKQGWTGNSFEPWPPRKTGADGRGILVKAAYLRDSIRIIESSPLRVVYGTSAPYAKIHNEGGVIQVKVTKKSRKFFWYMYKATRNDMWKAMALTKKKSLSVKIPKRQFIGESSTFLASLDKWINTHIKQIFDAKL